MKAQILQPDSFHRETVPLPEDVLERGGFIARIVGGPVQVIPLARDSYLCVNEEGKLHKLQINFDASSLVINALGRSEWIAGPAVLVPKYALP